jgi:DNA-binding SARP family transcriptional activator/Tfp pilus assembly protein PilF
MRVSLSLWRPEIVTVRLVAPVTVMLLGPPRVEREGRAVAFDTRKAIALLAYLALGGRPRPRDVLAELLWPERDAEHARGALRRTLSAVRGAVGPEALETTRDQVALGAVDVDVARFRSLAEAGDLEAAADVFRGDFLEGFGLRDSPAFEDWQRGEAEVLRRELATVLGRLAERSGSLAHARRWLELDPLHEPAHRALIRLYAASGDRAAALAQYRDCVRVLTRELGVPPLEETTRLYEAISEGTSEAPSPPPPGPPAARAVPLVGRDADRAALIELLGADGRVALIEGEAGIGKTRLAEELVAAARERGAAVLAGRAYEEESALAYGPLVEALRGRLQVDDSWLEGLPERTVVEAARLLPELGPAPPALDSPAARARFHEGVWETLAAAAAGGVLLVDDAHWADDATLGLLGYGLRRLAGRPLLVVLTWRTPHDHAVRRVVAEVARAGRGAVLSLARLGADEVAELLRAGGPRVAPELERRLYEETEGLPFLVVEYLRALDAEGVLALPAGARGVLRARLDPISETGRQVLAAAAVLGRSFDVDTVRAASGRGDEETVTALEELVAHGLIREHAHEYDFGHEQLRALVYEETSLARRRLLHGRAAEAVGSVPAVARHLRLAGREEAAAREYVRAAEQARAVFANAEALEHLRAALALGHPDAADLHTAIGDLQTLGGEYRAALASFETAAALAGADSSVAAIEHRLGQVHHRRGEWAMAEAHLTAALEGSADGATRARICADLALTVHDGGDPERAARLADGARELAEEAGDPRALGQAHNLLGVLGSGDQEAHLQRSLALAEELGDPGARAAALNNLAHVQRTRGALDTALELTHAALELCTAQGDRHREAALRNNLADLLHESGRPDEAMDQLKQAVAIFADVGEGEPQPGVWKLARW